MGFMGCGKSFLGKQIAKKLNMQFVDFDQIIETTEGVSIATIFAEKGESFFRQLEHQTLLQYIEPQNFCIATGGGTPCFYDNINIMNEKSITIYLKTSPELIFQRLKTAGEIEKRPLFKNKTSTEVLAFIEAKMQERTHFYEQAQIIIAQNDNDTEKIIHQILKIIKL